MACNYLLTIKNLKAGKGSLLDPFTLGPASDLYSIELLYKDLVTLKDKGELETLIKQLLDVQNLQELLDTFEILKPYESRVVWKTFKEHMNLLGVTTWVGTEENLPIDIPNFKDATAVTVDGVIYINANSDCSTAPLHELMHLVFGVMKSLNFKKYQLLLNLVEDYDPFKKMLLKVGQTSRYKSLTHNDKLEEAFCNMIECLVDENKNIYDFKIDDMPYDKIDKALTPFIRATFGLEHVPGLLSFLQSTVSTLPVKGSTLFLRSTIKSTKYSDHLQLIKLAGKVTNLISKWVEEQVIKEHCV